MKIATINFKFSKIGSGYRDVVIVNRGRKWVRLFYVPTLTGFNMRLDEFEGYRPEERDPPKGLAKTIRYIRRRNKRLDLLPDKRKREIRQILSTLEGRSDEAETA